MRKHKIIKLVTFFFVIAALSITIVRITKPLKKSDFHFTVQRFENSDETNLYETVSKYGEKKNSENIIIASSKISYDVLCSGPLSVKLKAPILLTDKNILDSRIRNEIIKLKPRNAYIIGDTGCISANVEDELNSIGINTFRISGNNECATSVQIAKYVGNSGKIFVVPENNLKYVLTLIPVAAKENIPIIVTDLNHVSRELENYISSYNITKTYIIGNQAVTSSNVLNKLPRCTRIYGNNAYEINENIIKYFKNELISNNAFITSGEISDDSLNFAVLAGLDSAPVILIDTSENKASENFMKDIYSSIKKVYILGGESSVPSWNIDVMHTGSNAPDSLYIPTYDGSNQACHPKVVYFKDSWHGWKYWMAMTPYPKGNDYYENPSIVVSNSGTKWIVPKGITNPLTPLPDKKGKHASDPELVYNKEKNELELWYRFTLFNKRDNIYRITSCDGIHWSKPQMIDSFLNKEECLSPAIICENKNYRMWYVNEHYFCYYTESTDGCKNWSKPIYINMHLCNSYRTWHIDVIHTNSGYEAVFCGGTINDICSDNRILFYNISKDGIHFGDSKVILKASSNKNSWDDKQIYRSTFVKVDGVYKLYYSAMDKKKNWNIGLSQGFNLFSLHGYNGNWISN